MHDSPRLKLLVITMMYEPDCVGIAAVASDMCQALVERGHDVTVYTTFPYYPEWKLKCKAPWRIQEETINRVQVRRHRIFVPSKPSRLIRRLLHELSFPVSLLRSFFHGGSYDVVMVYCPLMSGMAFAALRKLWFRDPLWINIQDIPAEAAAASGMIKSNLLARGAAVAQQMILNRADAWSSIAPQMIQRLNKTNRAGIPVHLCPNWLTGSLRKQLGNVPSKAGRTPQGCAKLLYCGTIGKKQGLLEFCQLLSKCEGDFRFEIRGEGSEAGGVRNWVEASGDGRFEFHSLSPQAEFIRAVHAADWFVIPQRSGVGSPFFPSKLIPAICVGTPILAISENEGALAQEVTDNGLGLVLPWSEVDQLTDTLEVYASEPERFAQLQTNCLRRAQAYERDRAIDHFEALLREECARSG